MLLAVGRVMRAHGVRGEVSVEVRTDEPDARFAQGASLITDPPQAGPLTVESARSHAGRLLVRFAGRRDRAAAEELRGVVLLIDSATIPPTAGPDEFHDHELIGLVAVTADGARVGEVIDVEHPGQDLLVVRRGDGGQALVPFVRAIVVDVDLDARRVVIDPPPGLLA